MFDQFPPDGLRNFERAQEIVRASTDVAVVTERYEWMRDVLKSCGYRIPASCSARVLAGLEEVQQKYQCLVMEGLLAREQAARDQATAESLQLFSMIAPFIAGQPGISQKDLHQYAPGVSIDSLRLAIYIAAQNGLVLRKKTGNSYRLTIASQ